MLNFTKPWMTKLEDILLADKVFVDYRGNAGTALTASVTNIDFNTLVSDSLSAWSGSVFTAPKTARYLMMGECLMSTTVSYALDEYISGVSGRRVIPGGLVTSHRDFSIIVELTKDQTWSLRCPSSLTLSNNATRHFISIASL